MTLPKHLFAAALLFCLPTAGQAAKVDCAAIDAAISANEDFVEVVLARDAAAIAKGQMKIVASYKAIEPGLSADQRTLLAERSTLAASKTTSPEAAAVAAMALYEGLVAAFESRLPAPRDVAMLDHAGFMLRLVAAASSVDWAEATAITSTLDHVDKLGGGDSAMTDLMGHIRDGLSAAIARKDATAVDGFALILLDTVDLLERVQKNPSPKACT